MENNEFVKSKEIYSIATDPIYIGTGGYTIGRVDNTIVRDPITKIPKIPGSSLAGTWRYYVALELQAAFKDEYKRDLSERAEKKDNIGELFNTPKNWMEYPGNRFARIRCAGQDEESQKTQEESKKIDTGHCGHCIVCKSFGYSKKDNSWQGMLFFSDLNILFFPVYTRLGTKWITSIRILKKAGLINNSENREEKEIVFAQEKIEEEKENGYINLGWLNLPYEVKDLSIYFSKLKSDNFELKPEDIIVAQDSLISQIINSNLEVRTSVSIDPITGAAKEGALFTSEAIPRGTVFYGEVRIFDKKQFGDNNLPSKEYIFEALDDTKEYYKTLGIGGMTTRGFGRMEILTNLKEGEDKNDEKTNGGGD